MEHKNVRLLSPTNMTFPNILKKSNIRESILSGCNLEFIWGIVKLQKQYLSRYLVADFFKLNYFWIQCKLTSGFKAVSDSKHNIGSRIDENLLWINDFGRYTSKNKKKSKKSSIFCCQPILLPHTHTTHTHAWKKEKSESRITFCGETAKTWTDRQKNWHSLSNPFLNIPQIQPPQAPTAASQPGSQPHWLLFHRG